MGEKTGISWCDHTFNPWWGCTKVSAGCAHCYAEAWAKRTGHDVFGENKPRRFFGDEYWNAPILWDAAAAAAGERRRVFCGSMCDVFESDAIEPSGADERDYARDALWYLIKNTPRLDWLLLTKRPENMAKLAPADWAYGWPSNVWALTTVENQAVADARMGALLIVPVKVRGLSIEPLLGPVDLQKCTLPNGASCCPLKVEERKYPLFGRVGPIHWLIIGCEKLPGNRPGRCCELTWIRDLIAQARAAGIPVFVKQIEVRGRVSADPAEWPEDLRIQEFPR